MMMVIMIMIMIDDEDDDVVVIDKDDDDNVDTDDDGDSDEDEIFKFMTNLVVQLYHNVKLQVFDLLCFYKFYLLQSFSLSLSDMNILLVQNSREKDIMSLVKRCKEY